ncbi:MAG: hypothetical protein AAF618_15445, partial [Pseudomonadota bacterium]
ATGGCVMPDDGATMARQVLAAYPSQTDRARALFPKLMAWHAWFMEHRVRDGMTCVTHPWESGRDNCPDWDIGMAGVDGSNVGPYTRRDTGHVDASMRPTKAEYDRYVAILEFGRSVGWDAVEIMARGPFLMADPGTHFILIRAHQDLAYLAETLGEDPGHLAAWESELRAGANGFWNEDLHCYDARDMRTGRFAGVLGSGAFTAYIAGADGPDLDAQMKRTWDAVSYGLPSSDPEGPYFDARRYWRGPVWPFLNALIALGLRDSGRHDLAERLRRETAALITKGGFNEYFDPTDGTPCGGADFTWTAAIWLTWAGREDT